MAPPPAPPPLKEALSAQQRLQAVNAGLQHKLADYLSHKREEEAVDPSRGVTDQEKRYLQCLGEGAWLTGGVAHNNEGCLTWGMCLMWGHGSLQGRWRGWRQSWRR